MDELLKWREEFPILSETTYLVSHSLGAMPRGVETELLTFIEMWKRRGVRAWGEGWWEMPLTVGDDVAQIIGAPPRTVAMHQNVSVCEALILSCFPPQPKRNKIVYSDLEFPTVRYVFEAHARNNNYRIELLKSEDGITIDLQRMLDAIDEETLLVPISHVFYKGAFIQDIKAITEKAHQVGAVVILDTYQSAGTIPFSVTELDVDFATGGSVKWLCAGPGAGYLYVHPRWHDKLEPQVTGWMAQAAPFAFEDEIRYADGIARFLHGSPSITALFSARAGYRIINEVGVEAIRAKSRRMTAKLYEMADENGFRVLTPRNPDERGGTLTFAIDEGAAVTKELVSRSILVDFRPGAGIRVSPHFYNSEDEIKHFIHELRDIVDTQAHRNHAAVTTSY